MIKAIAIVALVLGSLIFYGGAARAAGPALALEEGIAQYRAENFEEALVLLEKARSEQPQSALAAFYLGLARKQEGDLAGAIGDLQAAATLKPPVLDAFLELADAYHVSGDDEKALEWANRSESAGVNGARSAFMKGIVLAAQGKGDAAVGSFEKAKKLDVALSQPADVQIALVLAGSRKLSGARDALRAAVAADPKSEIASYAKEFEQAFSRIIENYRTWHLAVGLNYLYDDNAISNPSNPAAQALIGSPTGQTDHAFLGTLKLDYTPMLSGDALFSAQYLMQSTKYGDGGHPSTLINSLTLIPGYSFRSSILSLPVSYSHVLLKEEKYQQLVTTRPTWSWQLDPHYIVQGALSYSRREMLQQPLAPEENRDSDIVGATAGAIYSYGTRGGMAALRYDLSYDATQGSNWENRGHRVSLSGLVPLAERLNLNLSGEVNLQQYLHVNTLFGVRRDDTTWFATAGLTYNLTPNIVVSAQYAHTTADSNIPVYGYSRNTFSTGVEFDF